MNFWHVTAVDIVGILLALAGFIGLWVQVRRTKSAAESARLATSKAMDDLAERSTTFDLAAITSKISEARLALRAAHYETAVVRMEDLRNQLHALRSRRGFQTEDRRQELQAMIVRVTSISKSIESGNTGKIDAKGIANWNSFLGDVAGRCSEWAEELRSMSREGETT